MTQRKIVFKYGEFFCGPGGLSLGAIKQSIIEGDTEYKIEHCWANDYDIDSCETYRKNICSNNPNSVICKDIHNLDINSLEKIDAFTYGFPCNDFSVVGKQKGFGGKFGPLYKYGVAILNKFKPKFFVAENVGGLASANEGMAFKKIFADLKNSGNGYQITAHKYHAEDYGVPQTRHRIILVGIDKSLKLSFKVPAPTHKNKPVSVKEAFEKPPIKSDAFNNELKKQSLIVIERLKKIKPGENVWNANLPEHLKLKVASARLSQIYRRLHPDKPSYTITASGGGGTHGYHYSEPRALTNRERARIQTFPDDYYFQGKIESVRKQIGMAVPPKLARIIFTSILMTFAGQIYPYIKSNLEINNN